MKGWQIFEHSLRQVMQNFGPAMKVSGVLYLIQAGVGILLGAQMMGAGPAAMNGGHMMAALIALVVTLITGVWIAVAWHRYVLLSEEPTTALPPFMGDKMGAYFFKALLIGIVVVVLSVILGMIVGLVAMPLFSAGVGFIAMLLIALLVQVPMIFVGLRLAAALPGTAIGVDHGFLAGWEATADDWKSILQLSVIMALAVWVLNLIGIFIFGGVSIVAQLWSLIVGWPVMMVGLSILTTLYGHYIQKRPLV